MNHFKAKLNAILFTRGTKGDLYPFLRLGAGLKEKGCQVTLLSNFCYENYACQEDFDFVALDDEESFELLNNIPEFYSKLPSLLTLYKNHIVTNLEKELEIIESKISGPDNVIVAHSNDYLSPLFAMEKFNVPLYLCVLAPSFIHSFSLFEAVLKSLTIELNEIRSRIGLKPISDWQEWLSKFTRCFAFWPEWFSKEASESFPNLDYVGFLSIDSLEDKPLQIEIMDSIQQHTKHILITHGTSKPFNEQYFKLGINVCQKLGYKLIVGTSFRELLPEILPENVIWIDFCPFHKLLPLVDLIIHHGGIGTIRESIANSVPQLIIGQGFDRQHNGRIIKQLGLGESIIPKELSEDVLFSKVNSVLSDHNVKRECERYKSSLYNQYALDRFYEAVMEQQPILDLNKQNQSKDTTRIDGAFKYRVPMEFGPSTEARFTTAWEESNKFPAFSDCALLAPNKQELLLKILKNRCNNAQK